jgi:ribosomal protein S18 acetylase RimI-like enzyme
VLATSESSGFATVARNLRHAMTSYARSSDRGGVDEVPGLVLVNSGVPYAVFNAALLTESFPGDAAAIERSVRLADEHYARLRLPWSCWACEDFFDDALRTRAGQVFGDLGMRLVAEHQGMIAGPMSAADRSLPEMEMRRVGAEATRRDFVRLASEVFFVPGRVAARVYGAERFWLGHMIGWVGYVNNRPISIAATASDSGSVGVYSVGTLSAWRGRGYAERITRHAVESARQATGLSHSILQSTPAGMPLYRRLGFRPASRFAVYVSD